MNEIIIKVEGIDLLGLLGERNEKIDLIRNAYPNVKITARGDQIKISGDEKPAYDVRRIIEKMVHVLQTEDQISRQLVMDIINGDNPQEYRISEKDSSNPVIVYSRTGKPIKAKTQNQRVLVNSSINNDILFAIGPAGTGKTYTAVALAVRALKNKIVKKIILTRPAVEAGESLGFLPGDLKDKVDPYLRPLYDALEDMIPREKLAKMVEERIIEIAPLAFMRGRTLDNAFIILDEAQNATTLQIKMFLTRLGPSAKCIITGDLSQIDLPRNQQSGLVRCLDILKGIKGIGIVKLSAEDVVRHRLVKQIILAYDKSDNERKKAKLEKEAQKEKKETENKDKNKK